MPTPERSAFAPPTYGASNGAVSSGPAKPMEPIASRIANHNGAIYKALEQLFQISNRVSGSEASPGTSAQAGPPSIQSTLDAQENLIGQLVNLVDHLNARI